MPGQVSTTLGIRAPRRTVLLLRQLVTFVGVGGLLNVVYAVLYVALRAFAGPQTANAVALVLSTIIGTAAHRRLTFGVQGRDKVGQHQTLGLVLLGVGLAVTAGSLWLLDVFVASPTPTEEVVVLVVANLSVGLMRFIAFRVAMVPAHADDEDD